MFLVLSPISELNAVPVFAITSPYIKRLSTRIHLTINNTLAHTASSSPGTSCLDNFSLQSQSNKSGTHFGFWHFPHQGKFLVRPGRSVGQFVGQDHYLVLREGRSLHLFNVGLYCPLTQSRAAETKQIKHRPQCPGFRTLLAFPKLPGRIPD